MKAKENKIKIANGGIEYCLTESENEGIKVFGIRILCTVFGERDEFSYSDVTTDYQTAYELLTLLADYVVLPCTALEIIDEYIDTKARINI